MKNWEAFITGFLAVIFHSRFLSCQPFQHIRSHEVRTVYIPQNDPYINWTIINQRMQSPERNRDVHHATPLPSFDPVVARTERSHQSSPKKQKCFGKFCEEVDNYPEDLIKRIVSRTKNLDSYFKGAEVVFELNNRGAFDVEEDVGDTMCPTKSVTIFPKTAKNVKDEDRYLVNVDGYRQGIISETCLENASCKFGDSFPSGYVASCKQKYARRSLAILGDDNQTTAWDTFEVPSCCVCVIKRA